MKFFNTTGKINPKKHYFLPHRLDWVQLTDFIEKEFYFVLHAPRQSGKTTAIIEFVKHLNHIGEYTALYVSMEATRKAVNDVKAAVRAILFQFKKQIIFSLPIETNAIEYLENLLNKDIQEEGVYDFLCFWAGASAKPLALFLDEFDVLAGDSLITMLTQFRTGHTNRPEHFPQSICLIGVRDLRDYKTKTQEDKDLQRLYSPFNVTAESLLLPNFTQDDIKTLYLQHTQETGQKFTEEAFEYAFQQTQGQPWLVNALAYQACFREVKDRTQIITKEVMEQARYTLILRRDTHIDALVDRLKEPRVCKIMDAIISGSGQLIAFSADDVQYIRDLGLIGLNDYSIANPIYQEIIPRALIETSQQGITQSLLWYQNADGSINMTKLMQGYTQFFQENSELWLERFDYKESGPHLLMMAFMQRIINGGGKVQREYALGTKRVDLLVIWPFRSQDKLQRIVIEMKVNYGPKACLDGLEQTAEYMDKSSADEGHLVIFDHNPDKNWEEKIYHKQEVLAGKKIDVWGM